MLLFVAGCFTHQMGHAAYLELLPRDAPLPAGHAARLVGSHCSSAFNIAPVTITISDVLDAAAREQPALFGVRNFEFRPVKGGAAELCIGIYGEPVLREESE
jgi:hypothetical protein